MKRITPLLLAAIAGSAHAGPESMLNPLAMMNPMAGYGSPFGGYGNPFGGGFGGGYGNPLGGLNTLSALASLGMVAAPIVAPLAPGLLPMGQMGYPAMQMAPNMMSYGHYNQYGGGLFGGNPYLQRSLPNPMAPPAFSPSMPTMPFSPSQGTLPLPFGAPAQATMPSLPFMVPQAAMPPTAMPPAGLIPGLSPMAPAMPAPQSTPWSQAPATPVPSAQTPWAAMMQMPTPPQVAAPAAPPAAKEPAALVPMDPAAFMQMFMRPAESPAAPAR